MKEIIINHLEHLSLQDLYDIEAALDEIVEYKKKPRTPRLVLVKSGHTYKDSN